jgi:hypothetical protein
LYLRIGLQQWAEKLIIIFGQKRSGVEEVIKDRMWCDRYKLTEFIVVIVLSPSQIAEVCVGLANFSKSRFSHRVVVVLRMMFQSEIPVSLPDLVEAGIARYS